jgi:hypothetical protein
MSPAVQSDGLKPVAYIEVKNAVVSGFSRTSPLFFFGSVRLQPDLAALLLR